MGSALGRRMDKSEFATAMDGLVQENQKWQHEETQKFVRGERRARNLGHARGIFIVLLVAAIALFVNNYWGQFVNRTGTSASTNTKVRASVALQGVRQAAVDRDEMLD